MTSTRFRGGQSRQAQERAGGSASPQRASSFPIEQRVHRPLVGKRGCDCCAGLAAPREQTARQARKAAGRRFQVARFPRVTLEWTAARGGKRRRTSKRSRFVALSAKHSAAVVTASVRGEAPRDLAWNISTARSIEAPLAIRAGAGLRDVAGRFPAIAQRAFAPGASSRAPLRVRAAVLAEQHDALAEALLDRESEHRVELDGRRRPQKRSTVRSAPPRSDLEHRLAGAVPSVSTMRSATRPSTRKCCPRDFRARGSMVRACYTPPLVVARGARRARGTVASERLLVLNEDNFDDQITKAEGPVLVDFWAAWCGPCKTIAPTLEQLADEMAGQAHVAKVNVDENGDLANRFGIRSFPLFVCSRTQGVDQRLARPEWHIAAWGKARLLSRGIPPTPRWQGSRPARRPVLEHRGPRVVGETTA